MELQLVEVQLSTREDFLKVAETLTRIGVKSGDKLTQTCHILHKRGKYYICHYLEMFMLDGFDRTMDPDDIERRNAIIKLLVQWGLITCNAQMPTTTLKKLTIVPYNQKSKWQLKSNYTVGKKCTTNSISP